jgi:sulfoxide reductase heme-binding subunit YedZ
LISMHILKPAVFVACLVPAGLLIWRGFAGDLTANPIEFITHRTGDWTLRLLLITLAITPLRRLTGWNASIRLRRMLGLFAFFYGSLHFLTYVVLDHFFAFASILDDVTRRRYVTAGFAGFMLMIPLAVTSTQAMVRRLGGRRWRALHRLVYVSAIAGVVHYTWLVKADVGPPLMCGAVLAVLLGIRVWHHYGPVPVLLEGRVSLRFPRSGGLSPQSR